MKNTLLFTAFLLSFTQHITAQVTVAVEKFADVSTNVMANMPTTAQIELFFQAINDGNIEIVKQLINTNKAIVNTKNSNTLTPLMVATEKKDAELVLLLCSHGAHVNSKTNNGTTPLMIAARNNCAQITKILISQGANVDQLDNRGETALMLAAQNDHVQIVKILIQNDASIKLNSRTYESLRINQGKVYKYFVNNDIMTANAGPRNF